MKESTPNFCPYYCLPPKDLCACSSKQSEEEKEEDNEGIERGCDTMLMCIMTTLNHGLKSGGGIGDVLRKPKSTVSGCLCEIC